VLVSIKSRSELRRARKGLEGTEGCKISRGTRRAGHRVVELHVQDSIVTFASSNLYRIETLMFVFDVRCGTVNISGQVVGVVTGSCTVCVLRGSVRVLVDALPSS